MTIGASAQENGAALDGLEIPNDLGPKGREAIEAFFGRELVVAQGKRAGIYRFSPGGRVSLEQGGKVSQGYFGDSAYKAKMCLDFSFEENECYEVQQQGDALNFAPEAGDSFSAKAEPGPAMEVLPEANADYCSFYSSIIDAGKEGSWRSIIDNKRGQGQLSEMSVPFYWSTVSLGGDQCRIEEEGIFPGVYCQVYLQENDPGGDDMYESLVGQFRTCQKSGILEASLDQQSWLKYYGFGAERISEEEFKSAPREARRSARFTMDDKTEVSFTLSDRSICKDVLDCKFYNAVWVEFQLK
jgi:hypothetical protein